MGSGMVVVLVQTDLVQFKYKRLTNCYKSFYETCLFIFFKKIHGFYFHFSILFYFIENVLFLLIFSVDLFRRFYKA